MANDAYHSIDNVSKEEFEALKAHEAEIVRNMHGLLHKLHISMHIEYDPKFSVNPKAGSVRIYLSNELRSWPAPLSGHSHNFDKALYEFKAKITTKLINYRHKDSTTV